jgi:hypothetical protein
MDTSVLDGSLQSVDDLKLLVFAAVAVVAVLQLLTIAVLLAGRKSGRGQFNRGNRRPGGEDAKPYRPSDAPRRAAESGGSGGQRKPADGGKSGGHRQQGGRPQQERGGRSGQSHIDPVEMSLRDINQRLKNAEREQDSARRNLRDGDSQEGGGRGGRPQQREGRGGGGGGNRDDRPPRRDSGRDFNRDGGRREGRPERQDRGDGARQPFEQGRFRQSEQGADAPEKQERQERPQAPELVPNDIGMPEEQLQHGRRFTAKRRMLPDAPEPEPQLQDAAPSFLDGGAQGQGAEMQFGR